MKVGEALTARADLQKRIAQVSERLRANAIMQEGDEPPERPDDLLAELRTMTAELERLITAINLTNAAGALPGGELVTASLARRDVLALRQNVLRSTADAVATGNVRYSRSEIRMTRHVDAAALRREVDDLARERRELDTAIQEHNWTTELIEG